MSADFPPDYYFTGINFNSAFYEPSSTGFTQEEANLLYLQKTVADTATAIETFAVGVFAPSVEPIVPSSGLNIASTQLSGIINIANANSRTGSGTVNLNSGSSNASTMGIMNGSATTGILAIRTGGGSGATNIHTGTTTGAITIGSGNNVTNINSSTVNFTRNQSGTQPTFLECVTTTTTNQIDFHCNSANAVDYDSRILTSGGTALAGNGAIEILAGTVNLLTTATATGTVNIGTGTGGSAKVNIGNGSTTGAIVIGNSLNTVNINSSALSLGTASQALQVNTPIRINYAPTALTLSTQIGYRQLATITVANTNIPTSTTAIGSIVLTAGSWILNFYVGTNVTSALTVNDNLGQRISINTVSGVLSTDYALVGSEGVAITAATNIPTLGGVAVLQPTAGSTTYYLNYTISFAVGTITTSNVTHMNAVRIG